MNKIMKMKNYIIIVIIVVLLIGGYFVYQSINEPETESKKQVKVTDTLLIEENKICEGVKENCYIDTIIPQECIDEIEEIDLLKLKVKKPAPPGTPSRRAYYCKEINKFWVNNFTSAKPPVWYGPFDGYPVK